MKIAIDLGHGVGTDRGAVGTIAEETIINDVGSLVINKLKVLGYEVVEVRPAAATSVGNSLEQRTNKANTNNVDLYVSIHANAGAGVGTEIFTYNRKEFKQAIDVLANIVNLGFTNRGIKDGSNLYVIKNSKAAAMLIEVCFVDSTDTERYNRIGPEKIANAIVSGLVGALVIDTKKYYVVTNYLQKDKDGYVDINYVLSFLKDTKCYLKSDSKGIWIETQYLTLEQCNSLKERLGSWFYAIR